ncbi:hypothetical protein BDW62DRAFT_202852 [Aspergillus aurantiobrunneus]
MPRGQGDGAESSAAGKVEGEDESQQGQTQPQGTRNQAAKEKPKSSNAPSGSEEPLPKGPWGDRGVTHRNAGMYRVPENSSTLNVRINLDLRADVALELHAVVQGSVIIGLF